MARSQTPNATWPVATELADPLRHVHWKLDVRGCWIGRVGARGGRVKVFQRIAGHTYFIAVWEPRTGYRLASLGTRDRGRAERLALDAHEARRSAGADGWLAALRAAQERDVVPSDPSASLSTGGLTLGALWTRYASTAGMHLDNSDRTRADARMRAAMLVGYFGSTFDLHLLDEDAQHRYAAARRRGGIRYRCSDGQERVSRPTGPRSPQADLACLRAMLAWATRARGRDARPLLSSNPLTGTRRPNAPVDRRRPVATHERYVATLASMRRLREAAKSDRVRRRWLKMELALVLAEATGRRLGAIRLLRWEDIDWDRRTITWRADADKRGREWTTPVPDALNVDLAEYARRLTGCRADATAPVGSLFPAERVEDEVVDRHLFDHWLRVAERNAGLPKLRGGLWHAYRRKWAIERKHHPLADVAAAGGWTDVPTLVACYSLPDADTMLRVMSEPRRLRADPNDRVGGR